MTRNEFRDRFVGLAPERQARLLARLIYDVTLAGRGTYDPGTDAVLDPPTLRRLNETSLRLVDQLRHILDGRSERYPDDVFANLIWDHFDAAGTKLDLGAAS